MSDPTRFEIIPVTALLDRVGRLHAEHCRLVQIGATCLPTQLELNYSFDRNGELLNLRVFLPAASPQVPSISAIYWCAFIYENELHDLFGLQVAGMAVDFQGKFYQTAVKYPFGSTRPPSNRPAVATPAPPITVIRRAPPAEAPPPAPVAEPA
jgi:ech hydrogenase subunit D